MPNLPSSFASAAAGQNSQRDGRNNNSGEWSRSGRLNGTLTFRRPSTTPSQSISSQPAPADAVQSLGTTVDSTQRKYTRDELLHLFDSAPPADVSSLFVEGWNPGHVNGSNTATRGWGKSGESHVQPQEPDLCWDPSSGSIPSSLRNLTEEEHDLFTTDVNSPVKPPPQNKDGNALNGGRKTSISHGASLASPSSASRPGTRRRETTDTNPYSGGGGLTSPTSATREGGSFWLRKNEAKDAMFEEPEGDVNPREAPPGQSSPHPFAGLVRNNTATGVSGLGTASSLWGSSASTPSASALGSFGNFAMPASSAIGDKRPGGQSRLARLIPKDSNDNMAGRGSEPSSAVDARAPWRSRQRTDTDPFAGGDENLSGSAVLGGAQDTSPPPTQRATLFDTPVKGSASEFGMSGLNLGGSMDNEPLSPSETNPYRSPPGEQRGVTEEGNEGAQGHGLGLGGSDHVSAFGGGGGGFPRPFGQAAFEGSDRSQTSSVGAKPLPPLSTLGGWPTSATPDRERNPFGNAFGNSLFSPMGDLHSPSLGNLSGVFGPVSSTGIPGSGSIGRGSKLGSLFPPAMQSQMQNQDNESLADSIPDIRQINTNPLGAIGRNAFGEPGRNTDSPIGTGRGGFHDLFSPDNARSAVTSDALAGGISAIAQPQGFPQTGTPFSGGPIAEPPSAQARSMVMPDRMRWVYLDPQGHQQGPFTGLEMNDWYKANFFTADLRVKRVEDPEFEPLGQLIRRIGNSREPFLVPMMGIPHGPPAAAGPFSPSAGGGIVPPLNGVFPQFGRTLTAQEQNDLERRKQEEQYMMAQQRDLLSNQQRLARVQLQGHPGLHHHSSAHSLQSQPSFGSINSPITMPPQPPIGSIGGAGPFLGGNAQQSGMGPGGSSHIISDMFRDDELNARGPGPIGSVPSQAPVGGSSMESFRARLPQTQELLEDDEGFRGRLEEFEQLRAQHDAQAEQTRAALDAQSSSDSVGATSPPAQPKETASAKDKAIQKQDDIAAAQEAALNAHDEQADQALAAAAAAARSSGLPMPFPPPQSSTPLPAPAPQRVKSNLPEQYATSSRSETPENATQPPPLAPWAKDPASETHRGPSLREIQEAEAKKAAKAEEAAAAARRVMAEQEAAREREKMVTLASGLPTSSTWGTSSPAAATSPWTMPAATKAPAPGLAPAALTAEKKKTLADIQREEEARKNKAKETAVQSGSVSGAKRYADLASKPNASSPAPTLGAIAAAPTGAGWATVGAGGKVKVPTGPAAQSRSVSSSNIKSAVAPAPAPIPAPAARPISKPSVNTSRNEAMDEFTKWVQGQLMRGGVAEVDVYTQTLLEFPPDVTTITDVVYQISQTMNGREFANEFIRRKKLADKGVFEKQGAVDVPLQQTGGWNEVAKKNPHKENNGASIPSDFKVVPARKKGKK